METFTSGTKARFAGYELDLRSGELIKNGRRVRLQQQPLQVLRLLLDHAGQVVAREELQRQLWAEGTFVDFDHGLNKTIAKLRDALDDPNAPACLIETLPRLGYRFSATVEWLEPAPANSAEMVGPVVGQNVENQILQGPAKGIETAGQAQPATSTPAAAGRTSRWLLAAVAILALCLLVGVLLGFNVGGIRGRFVAGMRPGTIQSIAVLPLVNLSGDASQEYFADGVTDELITALAKNRSLRVVSRTTVMQYKGVKRPLRDIARELGVDGILEGSVARSNKGVHMTVQLIYAPTDTHIWAESYDRNLKEAVTLPSELSQVIAKEVKAATSPASSPRYINPEAHDAYLRGRYFWFSDHYGKSREYFEKAIQLQPDYAAAWSGLADAYIVRAVAGMSPPQEVVGKAETAARKAVELDGSLPEAHNTMAAVYLFGHWDWKNADAESLRALELNPNYAEARHLHSYILFAMNRPDEALQEQKRSTDLDPFERPWALGFAYIRTRQYDAAVNELRLRAAAQPENALVHWILSLAYQLKGMGEESFAETEKALEGDKTSAAAVRKAFESGGEKAVAEWHLNELRTVARQRYVAPYQFAAAYAALGRKPETLKSLEDAYREHSAELVFLQSAPIFDFLHSDVRYRALVKKMAMPAAY
jgi:TolB-like protein/DNA-binding winged helix-turn-helix (wHTH) protein/Tfp pilus assembly protein PilF